MGIKIKKQTVYLLMLLALCIYGVFNFPTPYIKYNLVGFVTGSLNVGEEFQVNMSLETSEPVEMTLYSNLAESVSLGGVNGRRSLILSDRTSKTFKKTISKERPYEFIIMGKIIESPSSGKKRVDFGELGYIDTPLATWVTFWVSLYPKSESLYDSEEGISSHRIDLRIE